MLNTNLGLRFVRCYITLENFEKHLSNPGKILLLSWFGYVLLSCQANLFSLQQNPSSPLSDKIEIKLTLEIKIGETQIFEIFNGSDDRIIVYNPAIKNIERLEGKEWRKVRILYCPCGANCEPPPETKVLIPDEKHILRWNLTESWCGEMQENNIPKTERIDPTPGLYRIKVRYSTSEGPKKTIWKEFKIIH